jgi:hypothetical protein
MSKRKYERDVSRIVYGWHQDDFGMGDDTEHYPVAANDIPVRIVRESFYRTLIKSYDRHKKERRGPTDVRNVMTGLMQHRKGGIDWRGINHGRLGTAEDLLI